MNARFLVKGAALQRAVDWEVVYHDLMPRVYNFFRYRVGDDSLAEDLTATTFTRAWRFRDGYSQDLGAFSTWLFTIAHNVANDHFRKQNPPHIPLDEHHLTTAADDEAIDHQHDRDRLTRLLDDLPPRDRELIALKYGAALTNRAIASMIGMSESNVGTTLHRIVQKLRNQWEETK